MTACKKWEFIHEHIEASNSIYGIRDYLILLRFTCIFYIFSNKLYWIIPKIGSNKCFGDKMEKQILCDWKKTGFRDQLRKLWECRDE